MFFACRFVGWQDDFSPKLNAKMPKDPCRELVAKAIIFLWGKISTAAADAGAVLGGAFCNSSAMEEAIQAGTPRKIMLFIIKGSCVVIGGAIDESFLSQKRASV